MVGAKTALAIVLLAGAAVLLHYAPGRADIGRVLPADRTAPLVYVALGDSTVEGVAATSPDHTYVSRLLQHLRTVYPQARAINLGRAGAMSADVRAHQLDRAIALRPDLVTLSVGPNDITGGVRVTDYERNLDEILRRLTRETRAVVVVNLLPDLGITPRFRASDQREAVAKLTVRFNEALARTARAWGAEIVDLYRASQEEVPRRPALVSADGYHPSDLGYARWADLLWAHIEPHILRP